MGCVPMLFYCWINLIAYLTELVWIIVGRPDVLGWIRSVRGIKTDDSKCMSKRRGRTVSQGGTAGSSRKEPTARTG